MIARRLLPFACVLAASLASMPGDANAQSAPALAPLPAAASAKSASDLGLDTSPWSAYRLSAPLRLSLIAAVPSMAGANPNCVTREEAAGNSSPGNIPIQHYWEMKWGPRLTLSAFSQLGCPIDAGIGTSVTYAIPLSPSLAFVASAGAYAAPAQIPLFGNIASAIAQSARAKPSPVNGAARLDVVWKSSGGSSYNLGIQSIGARHGVSFGGAF